MNTRRFKSLATCAVKLFLTATSLVYVCFESVIANAIHVRCLHRGAGSTYLDVPFRFVFHQFATAMAVIVTNKYKSDDIDEK